MSLWKIGILPYKKFYIMFHPNYVCVVSTWMLFINFISTFTLQFLFQRQVFFFHRQLFYLFQRCFPVHFKFIFIWIANPIWKNKIFHRYALLAVSNQSLFLLSFFYLFILLIKCTQRMKNHFFFLLHYYFSVTFFPRKLNVYLNFMNFKIISIVLKNNLYSFVTQIEIDLRVNAMVEMIVGI